MYKRPRKPPLPTEEWAEMHHCMVPTGQRKRDLCGAGVAVRRGRTLWWRSGDMENQVEEG